MYVPGELVAQAGQFGGADLAQQHGTVAELAQICQAWGAAIATLHTMSTRRFAGSARDAAVGIEPTAPNALGEGRGKGVGVRSSLGGL